MVLAVLLLLAMLLVPDARASWGGGYGLGNGAHAYAVSELRGEHYASEAETLTSNAGNLSTGGFITNEQWVLFNKPGYPCSEVGQNWIETGLMFGRNPIQRLHYFYAERTPSCEFFTNENPPNTPANVTYNEYHSTLIYDTCHCGVWEIWFKMGPPTWSGWKLHAATYGWAGGWPVAFLYQNAGAEIADNGMNGTPINSGRNAVAWSEQLENRYYASLEGGQWYPWAGAGYYLSPNSGMQMATNPEAQIEGDIQWALGTPFGASTLSSTTTTTTTATPGKMVVAKAAEGKTLTSTGPRPPGAPKPKGIYKATIKNSAHELEAEYVGNRLPTEEEVRKGGSQ